MLFVIIRKRTLTCIKKNKIKNLTKRDFFMLVCIRLSQHLLSVLNEQCQVSTVQHWGFFKVNLAQSAMNYWAWANTVSVPFAATSDAVLFPSSLFAVTHDKLNMQQWWRDDLLIPVGKFSLCLFVHQQEGHRVKYSPGGNRCLAQWHGKQGGCMPLLQMFFLCFNAATRFCEIFNIA